LPVSTRIFLFLSTLNQPILCEVFGRLQRLIEQTKPSPHPRVVNCLRWDAGTSLTWAELLAHLRKTGKAMPKAGVRVILIPSSLESATRKMN
jgi:hypothetical protein